MDFFVVALKSNGEEDVPLDEAGMITAKKIAKQVKALSPKIKTIFSSSRLQSIQTADFIHDQVSVKMRALPHFSENNETHVRSGLEIALKAPGPVIIVVSLEVLTLIRKIKNQPGVKIDPCDLYCFSESPS